MGFFFVWQRQWLTPWQNKSSPVFVICRFKGSLFRFAFKILFCLSVFRKSPTRENGQIIHIRTDVWRKKRHNHNKNRLSSQKINKSIDTIFFLLMEKVTKLHHCHLHVILVPLLFDYIFLKTFNQENIQKLNKIGLAKQEKLQWRHMDKRELFNVILSWVWWFGPYKMQASVGLLETTVVLLSCLFLRFALSYSSWNNNTTYDDLYTCPSFGVIEPW